MAVIVARDIRLESDGISAVLSCEVVAAGAGLPSRLWYRFPSEIAPLIEASGSAFVPTLLLVAMRLRRALHIEGEVSPALLCSLSRLMTIYTDWSEDFEPLWRVNVTAASTASPSRGDRAAAFFSGGLDSTFTASVTSSAAWHDFVLKLCPDQADDSAVTGSPPQARADGRKKILIVDDDPEVVEVLRRFLEKSPQGYVVEVASNGEDAVAALVLEAPDLVLLDLNMPRMNGVEVLRHVDRHIPVMIVSGNTDSMPAEALKLGAFAYIPKPVDFNYVEQLVPLALTQRRPPQAWVSKSGA